VGVIVPEKGGRIGKTTRWGLVPMWAKDIKIGNQAINARIESPATAARAGVGLIAGPVSKQNRLELFTLKSYSDMNMRQGNAAPD
jgi:SOS response associated peptidase (SRAP)